MGIDPQSGAGYVKSDSTDGGEILSEQGIFYITYRNTCVAGCGVITVSVYHMQPVFLVKIQDLEGSFRYGTY